MYTEYDIRAKLFALNFAPVLDTAAGLLTSASFTWHPWSLKRRSELSKTSSDLRLCAYKFRQSGLLALGRTLGCEDEHLSEIFVDFSDVRRGLDKKDTLEILATYYMVGLARELLISMFYQSNKVADIMHPNDLIRLKEVLCEVLEVLSEGPYYDPALPVLTEVVSRTASFSRLSTCGALVSLLAQADRKLRNDRGEKKKSSLSIYQLSKLAKELGIDRDILQEIFEQPDSVWSQVCDEYYRDAHSQKESALDLVANPVLREALKRNWLDEHISLRVPPVEFVTQEKYNDIDLLVRTALARLQGFQEGRIGNNQTSLPG